MTCFARQLYSFSINFLRNWSFFSAILHLMGFMPVSQFIRALVVVSTSLKADIKNFSWQRYNSCLKLFKDNAGVSKSIYPWGVTGLDDVITNSSGFSQSLFNCLWDAILTSLLMDDVTKIFLLFWMFNNHISHFQMIRGKLIKSIHFIATDFRVIGEDTGLHGINIFSM